MYICLYEFSLSIIFYPIIFFYLNFSFIFNYIYYEQDILLLLFMKKFIIILFAFSIVLIFGFHLQSNQFKYVGVTKCVSSCHRTESQGKQLEIWKNSKHSKAWKTLETDAAKLIAADKGYKEMPTEIPECIRCHLLGRDFASEELSATFEMQEGVQCESCHGAGSGYMKMSIMKDEKKSIENGLRINKEKVKLCIDCHNENSPKQKEFDLESFWDKIKHYKP